MAVDYRSKIKGVLEYIQRNIDSKLTLEELAQFVFLSPFHFHRIFKAMVGENVMEHVTRLKIERAAKQLSQSDSAIIDIAFDTGYTSQAAFTRAFRRRFQTTPKEYRKLINNPGVKQYDIYLGCNLESDFTPKLYGGHQMKVELLDFPQTKIACMRHAGPYSEVGHSWHKLVAWATKQKLIDQTTQFIGIGYDDPSEVSPQSLSYDACLSVNKSMPDDAIEYKSIPAGKHAVVTHKGPHDTLHQTYLKLYGDWLPQHGYDLSPFPCFVIYKNSPFNTQPEDLVTEIHLPLK